MPHNRYYSPSPLEPHSQICLEAEEWHHLAHVARGRIGDPVELIDGKGTLALARLESSSKTHGILLIERVIEEQPPPPAVILALAIPRMNHLEWAVEKATELGASALWLFPGKRSEKQTLSENQLTRLHSLMLSATKQCGRLYLPSLQLKTSLDKWPPLEGSLLICDLEPSAPYLWELTAADLTCRPIFFFIGPEKGWDPEELKILKTQMQARSVRLHPHILRAETAPLVALSLLQTLPLI